MPTHQAPRAVSLRFAGALIVVALLAGGGAAFAATRLSRHAHGSTDSSTGTSATIAQQTGATTTKATGSTASTAGSQSTSTTRPPVLSVTSISPPAQAVSVSPTRPITVTLSAPIAASSPRPTIAPAAPGPSHTHWNVVSFVPSEPLLPLSEITLRVPGGAAGVRSTDGGTLSRTVTEHFRIVDASILRLQQLLSLLDYSPLSWTPRGAAVAPGNAAAQLAALYSPPVGHFSWLNRGWPRQLRALWRRGVDNVFTRGLIMSFEADHGLTPNGNLGPSLWNALLVALQANTVNTGGYNFALANKTVPETLTVWHDGKVVIKSPANTGIAQSPTADGTFTVYSRLRSQVMKGTNPNGSPYADLVQYIAYFNGNDAVHYMPRAGYGIPQSLGCVELPYSDAAAVWPYLAYGTLVMVVN